MATMSSCRGCCQTASRSRKVLAALKVSVVRLSNISMTQAAMCDVRGRLPLPQGCIRSLEHVNRKALAICLGNSVVKQCVDARIVQLDRLQFVHEVGGVCHGVIALGMQSFLEDELDNVVIA